jgi:hypothetical protein
MRDDVKPLTPQEARQLEWIRREATFSGFEVRCYGCGHEDFEPCEGCPDAIRVTRDRKRRPRLLFDWRKVF